MKKILFYTVVGVASLAVIAFIIATMGIGAFVLPVILGAGK